MTIEDVLKYAAMVQASASIWAPQYNKGMTLGMAAARIAVDLWNRRNPDEPPIVLPADPELIAILEATATRGRTTGEDFLDSVA